MSQRRLLLGFVECVLENDDSLEIEREPELKIYRDTQNNERERKDYSLLSYQYHDPLITCHVRKSLIMVFCAYDMCRTGPSNF